MSLEPLPASALHLASAAPRRAGTPLAARAVAPRSRSPAAGDFFRRLQASRRVAHPLPTHFPPSGDFRPAASHSISVDELQTSPTLAVAQLYDSVQRDASFDPSALPERAAASPEPPVARLPPTTPDQIRSGLRHLLHRSPPLPSWVPEISPPATAGPRTVASLGKTHAWKVDWRQLAQDLGVPQLEGLLLDVARRTPLRFFRVRFGMFWAPLTFSV